jgi:hypothetical protein
MLAPSFAGSKTVTGPYQGPALVLLKGLIGNIEGKKYEGLMVSMATNDDAWIANVASYIRNSFGNNAGFVAPEQVARLRATYKDRTQPWTIDELRALVPHSIDRKNWILTASHNGQTVNNAIDQNAGSRWDTATPQVPGMWFQIELPEATEVAGLQLDATGSANDYPRGYEVTLSNDGKTWSAPVAKGQGNCAITNIEFAPAKAKFIKIKQTGSAPGLYWSIHELQVLATSGMKR